MDVLHRLKYCNPQHLFYEAEELHPFTYQHQNPPWGSKYGYLGQGVSTTPSSSEVLVKVNPNKTTHTIRGLQTGLKGAIRLTQEEILKNNEDLQGQQNAKSLQLQLKTLEYQLSRLESLEEEYVLQQKLREGVRSMAYAYTVSTGNHQKIALANVKAGFRECTETLGTLEAQLQEFLGAFHLTMKGIQGFARLCPGDVYEITVKHGVQKWKTRTKVTKDGSQEWDFPGAKVTAILGQELYIKAAEVKTLGKQVLLGNKFCEICELFSAHPQLMTVNLNPSGSLKLNIIVEWDPLAQFYAQEVDSPLRKRRMITSPMFKPPPPLAIVEYRKDPLKRGEEEEHEEETDLLEELKENLNKLGSVLNDEIQGQYPELEMCEVNIAALRRIANQEYNHTHRRKGRGGVGRFNSNSSLNIESALEAFDFLDNCELNSPPPTQRNHSSSSSRLFPLEEDNHTPSKKHPTDSGISSLTSNSRSPSPAERFLTGSEQLDIVLNTHIIISLKLVNNLGAFGPLKWKERRSLGKLQQQATILGNILNRIHNKEVYEDYCLFELEGTPFIQKLWTEITQSGCTLCTTADQVAYGLEPEIRKEFEDNSSSLSKSLVMHILDEDLIKFQRHKVVTLFQFLLFLKPYQTSFYTLVKDIAEEEEMSQKLKNLLTAENISEIVSELGQSVPPPSIFLPLAHLLSPQEDPKIQEMVSQYFLKVSQLRRQEVLENCLEMFESSTPKDRLSALHLLHLINGEESVQLELAYLAQTDDDPEVKLEAKKILSSQKEGVKMHAQLTLNSHGFQGLMANNN